MRGFGVVLRGSLGGTLGVEGFLVALRAPSQKADPALSNAQPCFAIRVGPRGTRLLLSVGRLAAIFVGPVHAV
jgi:hypothetical protein